MNHRTRVAIISAVMWLPIASGLSTEAYTITESGGKPSLPIAVSAGAQNVAVGAEIDRIVRDRAEITSSNPPGSSTETASAPVPTTRTVSSSGCQSLISSANTCSGELDRAKALCPDTFIQIDQTVQVFDLESWQQISIEYIPGYCPPTRAAITITAEDFKTLTLDSSSLNIEPHNLNGYVNLPVFVHTTAKPQQLTTQVLGTDVLVKATPTSFTFTYGDTTPPHTTTTNPGAPYPDKTNAHTYRKPGSYTITLETTWSGQFSINNGQTWQDIDGSNNTTSPPQTVTISESTPLLTG